MSDPPATRPSPPRVLRALEQFAPMIEARSCLVEPIGRGVQAQAYSIRSGDRGPGRGAGPDLVLKLYRDGMPDPGPVAAEEFECLGQLHRALDGRLLGGWTVRVPAPLARGEGPHALLMTRVPGRSLNAHLGGPGGGRARDRASLARAILAALEGYWRDAGRIYGDLDFNNILVDPATGTLAFIDPGMPGPAYLCEGVARSWAPASRDLAYLLFDAAVSVRSDLGKRPLRGRRAEVIEAIVLGYAAWVGPEPDRLGLLDEVHACARAHLGRVRAGWSPAGAWRLLLKGHASRSLARSIARLKEAAAGARPGVGRSRVAHGEVPCRVDPSR